MTIRAVPCPECRRVPETRKMEGCLGFLTECPKCKGLCAFGNTEDDSRRCWNHCIDAEDYRMDYDPINRPSHYCEGRKYETIEVIEAWGLGVNLGNALKYVSRAGRKEDTVKDLEKAIWYLNREVSAPFLRRAASRLSRWILRKKITGRIKLNDVTVDWKKSSNLSFAIASIHKGSKRYLISAMMLIEYEIEEIREAKEWTKS